MSWSNRSMNEEWQASLKLVFEREWRETQPLKSAKDSWWNYRHPRNWLAYWRWTKARIQHWLKLPQLRVSRFRRVPEEAFYHPNAWQIPTAGTARMTHETNAPISEGFADIPLNVKQACERAHRMLLEQRRRRRPSYAKGYHPGKKGKRGRKHV